MQTDIVFSIESFKHIDKKSTYDYEENSFRLNEVYDTRSLYIGHQYLTLEVDTESGYIIGLSGYYNLNSCESFCFVSEELNLVDGSVKATFKEAPEPGVGYPYTIPGKSYYDAIQRILIIGNNSASSEIVQINKNLVLGLQSGKLISIMVKNI